MISVKFIVLYKLIRILFITSLFLLIAFLVSILGINLLLQTNSAKGVLVSATKKYVKNLYFQNITFIPWRLNISNLFIPYSERKYDWLLKAKNVDLIFSAFPLEIKKIILTSPQINIITIDNLSLLRKLIQKNCPNYSFLPKEFFFKNCELALSKENEVNKFNNLTIEAYLGECDYKLRLYGENLNLSGSLNLKDWVITLNGTAFKEKISISAHLANQNNF